MNRMWRERIDKEEKGVEKRRNKEGAKKDRKKRDKTMMVEKRVRMKKQKEMTAC